MGLTATIIGEPAAATKLRLATVIARRILLAALLTALLMAGAIGAMFVTTAPAIVSLLLEPFSLLLTPGLLAGLLSSGPNDLSPITVVTVTAGFYFGFFYLALWWFGRSKRRGRRGSR